MDFTPGENVMKTRELLYRLILSQLFYDGYQQIALQLSNVLQVDPPCPPSERLLHVAKLGLERESEGATQRNLTVAEEVSKFNNSHFWIVF